MEHPCTVSTWDACVCRCLPSMYRDIKFAFYIVAFCIGQPKQLLFLFIASLIYVPTSQFTKSVLLMTAAIIIVVFCGLAKGWGLLGGLLPKALKGLRWIHCQNESPLSILFSVLCQGLRHFLFSFFCRLPSPHCGFLHSQRPGSARLGERGWPPCRQPSAQGKRRALLNEYVGLIMQRYIINEMTNIEDLTYLSHLDLSQKPSEE